MPDIEYIEGPEELLFEVKPLWEKLRDYHISKTEYFKDSYVKTFEERIKILKREPVAEMRVVLVKDNDTHRFVGYCISTVKEDATGEIDSIFIEEEYRGLGVGNELMQRSLAWLKAEGAKPIELTVGSGNESVFKFYGRFGFRVRRTALQQVDNI